jgi:centromere/kinetochore protein ZW10
MYLAHQLLTLMYKYKKRLIHSQDFNLIYIDQVLLLRQVGSEYFLNHMKFQRNIISDILRESGMQIFIFKLI